MNGTTKFSETDIYMLFDHDIEIDSSVNRCWQIFKYYYYNYIEFWYSFMYGNLLGALEDEDQGPGRNFSQIEKICSRWSILHSPKCAKY